MIPPVAWAVTTLPCRISARDPDFTGAALYYYIFESVLSPGVFKLGVTSNLERRWLEHGGTGKHSLIRSCLLPKRQALELERLVKTRLHSRRITDGNELFALDESDMDLLNGMIDEAMGTG